MSVVVCRNNVIRKANQHYSSSILHVRHVLFVKSGGLNSAHLLMAVYACLGRTREPGWTECKRHRPGK